MYIIPQKDSGCFFMRSHEIMLHLYSLIWFKKYVRSTLLGVYQDVFVLTQGMTIKINH